MSKSLVSVIIAEQDLLSRNPESLNLLSKLLENFEGDYELIVVDNASTDGTLDWVQSSLDSGDLKNTILFSLAQKAEIDAALWIGVDSAIGDFVITLPVSEDNLDALPLLLAEGSAGTDVAIAVNRYPSAGTVPFKISRKLLGIFVKGGAGSFSRCMVLSRRLVAYLQQHSQPQVTFRQLTQVPGLNPHFISYKGPPISDERKKLSERYASGIQFVLWRNPRFLRGASLLALFGAIFNFAYAIYVVTIFLTSSNVEPGWASSSLQFSGMFLLFSLALFILSENVLLSISIAGRDPVAFVTSEFASRHIGQMIALNVQGREHPQEEFPPEEKPPQ